MVTMHTTIHDLKSFLYFLCLGFSVIILGAVWGSEKRLGTRLPREIVEPGMAVTAIIPAFGR